MVMRMTLRDKPARVRCSGCSLLQSIDANCGVRKMVTCVAFICMASLFLNQIHKQEEARKQSEKKKKIKSLPNNPSGVSKMIEVIHDGNQQKKTTY